MKIAWSIDVLKWLKRTFDDNGRSVNELLEQYALLMENHPRAILDISMLPLPKAKMKTVLKTFYEDQTDPGFQNYFERGYLFLSQFQEGVGVTHVNGALGSDDLKLPERNTAILERNRFWQELVLKELSMLMCEWKQIQQRDRSWSSAGRR